VSEEAKVSGQLEPLSSPTLPLATCSNDGLYERQVLSPVFRRRLCVTGQGRLSPEELQGLRLDLQVVARADQATGGPLGRPPALARVEVDMRDGLCLPRRIGLIYHLPRGSRAVVSATATRGLQQLAPGPRGVLVHRGESDVFDVG
jgi:hypothetical protein